MIARAHQDELTVWVGVGDARFAEEAAVRRAAEGDQQFAIGPADNRRKGAVKLFVLIDNEVLEFAHAGRSWLQGRFAVRLSGGEEKDNENEKMAAHFLLMAVATREGKEKGAAEIKQKNKRQKNEDD